MWSLNFIVIFLALISLEKYIEATPLTPYNKNHQFNTVVLSTNGMQNITLNHDNEDATLTVPKIIAKYGYPSEIHEIITEDNYILQAHRIPYGKKCGPAEGKRVVWLQHGLLGDSSNWIISGPDRGLAYELADACYDVWLGNFRGNTYSRNHLTLNSTGPNRKEYWRFSWHEMGVYDVPANIDYALNVTRAKDLYYIGHSMGTTTMWVCLSEKPEYNSKIKLFSALAPVAYMQNMRSYVRLLTLYLDQLEDLAELIGWDLILPSDELMKIIGQLLCKYESPTQPICSLILFLAGGFNEAQMDYELIPIILGHSPAGSSTRTVIHYGQEVLSTEFRQYDHGPEENMEKYGQETPPLYNISKITAPVALYWGENDFLSEKSDMLRFAKQLPNLQRNYRVNDDKFTHLDFIWAKDQHSLINEPVMQFMEEFTNPTLTTTTPAPSKATSNTSGILFSMVLIFICISF